MEHKSKQLIISIIAIVILVLLAVFLFQGVAQKDSGELTEAERQSILESLANDSEVEPLTEEERQSVLEGLGQGEVEPLTEEERQAILDQLAS